jgi:hypothetical protein
MCCRRLGTAGNEAFGRWGLPFPHPRFPLRSACLADGSLPRATRRLAGGGCRSHNPAFRCARLFLKWLATAGNVALGRWRQPPSHPRFPLLSVCLAGGSLPQATRRLAGGGFRSHPPRFPLLSVCLAGGSLPRATRRLAGGGCRSHTPAFRFARLVLQADRYRGQRGRW